MMKKFLYLLSAFLLVFNSCSSDDNTVANPETNILVKRIVQTEPDGSTYTTNINYNGNKIVSTVGEGGYKTNYTYTGDVITKIESFNSTTEYIYSNGKLTTMIEKQQSTDKTYYTYNPDGTVSYKELSVINGMIVATGTLTFEDGNLIQSEHVLIGSGGDSESVIYEYDTKNSPFKNILGFSLLLNNIDGVSVNNPIKKTYTNVWISPPVSDTYIHTNTYKYNEEGFPTEIKNFDNNDGTKQFFYE